MNRALEIAEPTTVENNFGRKKRNAQESPKEPKQHCTAVEVM